MSIEKDKKLTQWLLPGEGKSSYDLVVAAKRREWMDVSNGYAYRCLPLSVANGYGWEIINPISFTAIWNGNLSSHNAIKFEFCVETMDDLDFVEDRPSHISSHFGNGIITFSYLRYIFKTSPGHNLFVKGPTNFFRHGAQALEAIIETDWLPYTFTLNWKITKPYETVTFLKGEPLATIFPIPRYYLESFDCIIEQGEHDSDFSKTHKAWAKKRDELQKTQPHNSNHKLYMKGIYDIENNKVFPDHQRRISGCPFINKNLGENNE